MGSSVNLAAPEAGTYARAGTAPHRVEHSRLKRLAGLAKHLAETPKGGRHQALYSISRTLGQLVASGHLAHTENHNALVAAADSNGLLAEDGERNVAQTIGDGIAKGVDDGPDSGHHETGERNPYSLTPPSDAAAVEEEEEEEGEEEEEEDDVPEIDCPPSNTRSSTTPDGSSNRSSQRGAR